MADPQTYYPSGGSALEATPSEPYRVGERAKTGIARVRIPAQGTAGTEEDYPVLVADDQIKVTKVEWIPDTDVTGDDTDNFALAAINKGTDGTGTTAVAPAHAFETGDDPEDFVAYEISLSGTAANRELSPGEVLALARTVNGSGLASPDAVAQITYEYV